DLGAVYRRARAHRGVPLAPADSERVAARAQRPRAFRLRNPARDQARRGGADAFVDRRGVRARRRPHPRRTVVPPEALPRRATAPRPHAAAGLSTGGAIRVGKWTKATSREPA